MKILRRIGTSRKLSAGLAAIPSRARLAARNRAQRDAVAAMAQRWCDEHGLVPPRPIEELAVYLVALGEGLGAHREIDPDAISPTAFSDGMAFVWFGMMASDRPDDSK